MTAIVYSGSKNAFWKLIIGGKIVEECTTPGMNPFFNDQKEILSTLNKCSILINRAETIKKIFVFAAGASSEGKRQEVLVALQLFFKYSRIVVRDDMYGAALAACFNEKGIVGIIGSGSNCAYFDGKELHPNNYGLGYILGDEGSANHFGRNLLKNYLEERLPEMLRLEFEERYSTDRPQILERVYRKPEVQGYLSSFLEFLTDKRDDEYVKQMIDDSFNLYIKTYLLPLIKQNNDVPVHFVGSVAGSFPDRLRAVALQYGIKITSITKEPIYNLTNYYSNKS